VGGWFTYNGIKRTMARREVAQEVLPPYQALRQQVIDCMPSWARYAGTPTWAQMTAVRAKLNEAAKIAGVPQDDRGFPDAVAFALFDHFLAVLTKQEAEALMGWMAFQAELDGPWYLTPRAQNGLAALAHDEAFIALRRKLDQVRRKYDGMDHTGVGIPVTMDPFEGEMMIAQRMGREVGPALYRMVRGQS
jgi:hypothetical protein